MNERVAVTGMGLVSASGCDVANLTDQLRAGRSGIGPLRSFDTAGMKARHAAEVADFEPESQVAPCRLRRIDRATQMALAAAEQALRQAALPASGDRVIGIAVGVSGAGQFQHMPVPWSRKHVVNRWMALYQSRTRPYFQTFLIAQRHDLHGPQATFSAASLGGALALGYAIDMLRAGKADAMLAGGGEIQTLLNALGMEALDLVAAGPCSPFSGEPGMTFGEGAAFLVLETETHARRRQAVLLGELVAYGVSADAYHDMINDPAGGGLRRAMRQALAGAGLAPRDIAWVRASGTGHREQDAAESVALCAVFDGGPLPPVTSTEPYFGHVNGVSPVLGLVAALSGQNAGRIPGIPDVRPARPGCDLPLLDAAASAYVEPGDFLLNAVAFGGGNAALVAGPYCGSRRLPPAGDTEVAITGIGVVSPLGHDRESFLQGLRAGRCGLAAGERFANLPPESAKRAGLVPDFQIKTVLPQVDPRRRERLVRYALCAAGLALQDAGLGPRDCAPDRKGLIVALAQGPMGPYERFFETVLRGEFNASTAHLMLRMGRFSVAAELSYVFGAQGYCATVCHGVSGGLHALAQAAEILRRHPELDALLVVAADEVSALSLRLFDALGVLAAREPSGEEWVRPYDPRATGSLLGEGAAALLLERSGRARTRSARVHGRLIGCGLTADATPEQGGLEPGGRWLERAVRSALQEAVLEPADLDGVMAHGCGWPAYDAREVRALTRLLDDQPVTSVAGNFGLAESAGGLFGAAAALWGMAEGEFYPIAGDSRPLASLNFVLGGPLRGDYRHCLLAGSTERGANAAVIVARDG
ncbi:MAG TPA: beta-ketoacyl synthase N-terminal-like domain-containing protein [Candidatus Competibacter sp.]|nr:beta-ketoacyl synthase N-terminal-like domain-containing protein [Candidatus Competibacter sp.]